MWAKFNRKKSLFVRSDILGLLDNTLTADEKYFHHNRERWQQPIQVQLSEKPKPF